MALHGGQFETYYSRARVTHIVCTHLPDTKLKQLVHERYCSRGGTPARAARAAPHPMCIPQLGCC
jgi:DNA repair protein REV1